MFLIRRQNKKGIVNMHCTQHITINYTKLDNTQKEVYSVVTEKMMLGEYSSEEKALKVLDMIEELYIEMWRVENGVDNAKKASESVFTMPQDDEIEITSEEE